MPIQTDNTFLMDKKDTFSHRSVMLLCGILLFSAALFAGYCHYQAITANIVEAAAGQPAELEQPAANPPAAKAADPRARTPSIWPAKGAITSGFGWRVSPFGDGNEMHAGVDIAYTQGAPVVATADGQVVQSGWAGGYGNMVQIDHGNGITTIYGHNSQLAVSAGQTVKKGQVISYAGSTGKSTGPHVHYEVRVNDTAVEPWQYLVLY